MLQLRVFDNAREYFYTSLSHFLDDLVYFISLLLLILHNKMEWKNVSETLRVLLFHMSVPKSYWSDAMLTACYIINRVCSIIFGGQIPLAVLTHSTLLFHLPPKIFGCVCNVHILGLGVINFIFDLFSVFFLGTQKGYRCYFSTSLSLC